MHEKYLIRKIIKNYLCKYCSMVPSSKSYLNVKITSNSTLSNRHFSCGLKGCVISETNLPLWEFSSAWLLRNLVSSCNRALSQCTEHWRRWCCLPPGLAQPNLRDHILHCFAFQPNLPIGICTYYLPNNTSVNLEFKKFFKCELSAFSMLSNKRLCFYKVSFTRYFNS